MGHLVVMDDSEAQLALTDYSCRLWRKLMAETGEVTGLEYDACGTLWVAADDAEMTEVLRKKKVCDERGVAAEVWDATRLAREEPNLRKGLAGALFVREDGVIYPPAAAEYLLRRAREKGAVVKTGMTVMNVECDMRHAELGKSDMRNHGWMKKRAAEISFAKGERVKCGVVIVAAGCASPHVINLVQRTSSETAALNIPVKKRKGHLVITDRYPGFVRRQLVELGYLKSAHGTTADSVAFNVQPRKTGQVLIGSSRQYDAEGLEVDHEILGRMIARAAEYMPGITNLQAIRVWTGHRPSTPDKLPLIGPSVNNPRVWLATGHEGLGITTALGTGRIMVDMLMGKETAIDERPFLPGRFEAEVGR
jgi:glycine/D-amino acid oxidase-like deaminating enzyme